MAEAKFKLKKGTVRTPEEHREIINQIDSLQKKRSAVGVHTSKQRMFNTFGVSTTKFRKKRNKPSNPPRVHMQEIYDPSFARNIKSEEKLASTIKKYI